MRQVVWAMQCLGDYPCCRRYLDGNVQPAAQKVALRCWVEITALFSYSRSDSRTLGQRKKKKLNETDKIEDFKARPWKRPFKFPFLVSLQFDINNIFPI